MIKFASLLKKFGPGFITGSSDDDPSGIATYTQVGASFGLGLLWTALLTLPLMIAVQEMVGRIGLVTGQGLTAIVRKRLPKWVLYVFVLLLLIANTINIGADLGAMADVSRLLFPQVHFVLYAIGFTVLILVLEIFLSYRSYAKVLKWFALALFSYVLTAFIVTSDWSALLAQAIVPTIRFDRDFFIMLTALFGTTISPYLFIWQSDEEVEEEVADGKLTIASRRGASSAEINEMRQDTIVGMGFSQAIMFCIIVTAASAFFKNGLFEVQSSAEAAQALVPLAGKYSSLIFSIGVIGTGLLAIPVLSASASYAM